MGDQWEEQRLENRESFREAHRLHLNQEESDQIVNLRAAVHSISDELLHHTKVFKTALSNLSGATGFQSSDTLRVAYAKLAKTKLVSSKTYTSEEQVLVAKIAEARSVMDSLGSAVSSMMGINRCILSLNEAKEVLKELELSIHTRAVLAMKTKSDEFYGQIMQVETSAGSLLDVRPDEQVDRLVGVSMNSTIQELMNWKAIG